MIQSVTWWAHSGMAWKSSAAPSLETRSGIFSVKDTNFHLEEALWSSYSSAEVRDLVVTSLWSHQRGCNALPRAWSAQLVPRWNTWPGTGTWDCCGAYCFRMA